MTITISPNGFMPIKSLEGSYLALTAVTFLQPIKDSDLYAYRASLVNGAPLMLTKEEADVILGLYMPDAKELLVQAKAQRVKATTKPREGKETTDGTK
jgi:hypothetical protein